VDDTAVKVVCHVIQGLRYVIALTEIWRLYVFLVM